MEKVADEKAGAGHTAPIVAVFERRIEKTFKRLAEGGRTPELWVQYHYMVDIIKIFIRTERLADHDGHLSCIVTRMLDIFSAAGHHQYAEGARLYCQLMKQLESSAAYKETFDSFTAHGNHVVRYSCHDWSGMCGLNHYSSSSLCSTHLPTWLPSSVFAQYKCRTRCQSTRMQWSSVTMMLTLQL